MSYFRNQISRLATRLLAQHHTVRAFPTIVVNSRRDVETSLVIERLEAALALLFEYMPTRYRHAEQDIAGFLIDRRAHRGKFLLASRVCVVELTFMVNPSISIAQIAAVILHEAMHARLHARQCSYDPSNAARHERFCRRAELKFGLLVPDGAAIVARAQELLDAPDEIVAPTMDFARGRRQVIAEDLKVFPGPEWLRRCIGRLAGINQTDRGGGAA